MNTQYMETIPVPFWDIVRSRGIPVIAHRRLGYQSTGAYEAAKILGVPLKQVVVSTIYWCGNRPLLVLSTADARLNLDRIGDWFGTTVRPANSIEVSALAGTHLQGVPPHGLAFMMPIFVDEVLLKEPFLWVTAGDPALWLCLTPENLLQASGAYPVPVRYPVPVHAIEESAIPSLAEKARARAGNE